jgi:hypothetical protein
MQKKPTTPLMIRLVSRSQLCEAAGISPSYLRMDLMPQLTERIHWFRLPGGRKILYQQDLILDFLINGNSPAHQKACDAFIRSLPSSQAA